MTLLDHVLVPVASESDAHATVAALEPYLDEIDRITAVHVVEKGGGSIDKAPVDKRRSDAEEFLAVVASDVDGRVPVDTRVEFDTDVVDAIYEAATDAGATAVAFRPRGGSRIVQLLTGDTTHRLVTDPQIPVVSLSDPSAT